MNNKDKRPLLSKLIPFADDILIFAGCFLITGATFSISTIIGVYLLGAELLVLGLLLARAGAVHPKEGE